MADVTAKADSSQRRPRFRDDEWTPTKGWGPWRAEWYSFCSKLHGLSAERRGACPACNAGSWHNVWVHRIDGLVWKHARPVALWWHNRPNSKAKRTLAAHFPGLRRRG